ncbi:hypothetical protein ACIOEX_04770 [Streptomyces sp. NPDC087850]|uniref:hypothetical protein n=1 Tax=Streptomyces sp. NPDC087850 TaxID=3365809 RepID=UPI0037FEAEFD
MDQRTGAGMLFRKNAWRALAAAATTGGLLMAAVSANSSAAADASAKPSAAVMSEIGRIATEHHALGLYETDQGAVVMLPSGTATRTIATATEKVAPGVDVQYKVSKYTASDVDRIKNKLTDRKWHPEADKHGFTVMYDAETDRVNFGSTAPDAVKTAALKTAPGDVVATWAKVEPLISRYSDAPPFFGGDQIASQWGNCTSGANVQDAHGKPFAVTAAHCGGTTDDFRTGGRFGSPVRDFGELTSRDDKTDLAVIDNVSCGKTLNGHPWCFDNSIYIGGADQDTYNHLKVTGSAGTFLQQTGLEVSGATTGLTRGYTVVNNGADVCYGGAFPKNTCITNGRGIALANPCCLAGPGDSGGPVFFQPVNSSNTTIVGTVSGGITQADGRKFLMVSKFANVVPLGYIGVYRR